MAEPPPPSPPWADLLHEALVHVLLHLEFQDAYLSFPLVCRNWRLASLDPASWALINIDSTFHSRPETSSWWHPDFERRMDYMVKLAVDRSRGNLRELRTRHCSDSAVLHLAARCHGLKCISITSSLGITDISACHLAASCPELEYLDVSGCPNVTYISLQQFGLNCKKLTSVKRSMKSKCPDIMRKGVIPEKYFQGLLYANTDEEAIVISKLMWGLKSLVLSYSPLTDQGLKFIVQGCPSLEYLDLTGCSSLTRSALDHAGKALKSLKVFFRPRVSGSSHLHGRRFGQWQMRDPEYRGPCYMPLPNITRSVFPYSTNLTESE